MEFFAVIAVIVVLCIILGVSTSYMIMAALALVGLIIIVMTLFFIYFFVRLLFSKRTPAKFLRVEQAEGAKFRNAYYLIEGEEYPCIFPSEPKFMYKEDRPCKVMFNKRMGRVFDKFAVTSCVGGLIFSTAASAGVILLISAFFL